MKTEFDDFNSPNGNFSGNEFPYAPAYTVVAGGMCRDLCGWFAGVNMRHTDGYYSGSDLQNSPLRFVNGSYGRRAHRLGVGALQTDGVRLERARQREPGDDRLGGVTVRGQF